MLTRVSDMFRKISTVPVEPIDCTRYAFRPGLVGGASAFELTNDGLSWISVGRSGVWSLDSIAAIRLSYRPIAMQGHRFRADIDDPNGKRLMVYSTTWQTASLMARQDDAYRAFIVELHRRLAATGSKVLLVAGINPKLYYLGLALMSLVGAAMAVLLLRALWIGEFVGALFLIGFAALFFWRVGGFMKCNRPRRYTFNALPEDVLPRCFGDGQSGRASLAGPAKPQPPDDGDHPPVARET